MTEISADFVPSVISRELIEMIKDRLAWIDAEGAIAIAQSAVSGSPVAQFIVATAFEERGYAFEASMWYQRSAAQGYAPAIASIRLLP